MRQLLKLQKWYRFCESLSSNCGYFSNNKRKTKNIINLTKINTHIIIMMILKVAISDYMIIRTKHKEIVKMK